MRRPSRRSPILRHARSTLAGLLLALLPPTHAANPPAPTPGSPSLSSPNPHSSTTTNRSRFESLRPLQPRPAAPTPTPTTPTVQPAPAPPPSPAGNEQSVLRAQIDLASRGFSPGSVDGVPGPKTAAALRAFQLQAGLPPTATLTPETLAALHRPAASYTEYVVTQADLDRLSPVGTTWLGKSLQTRLDYETMPELVAEKTRSSPTLIHKLNPTIDWTRILPGLTLTVPNITLPEPADKAAFIRICLDRRTLQAFDSRSNLLAHFPCSIGRNLTQRPVGQVSIEVLIPNPNYTFNPAVFPESEEGRRLGRSLIIPPGPNNPVGSAWIGLSLPGYGIHGTPKPETVGQAESHGCFRLSNWNAQHLMQLCWISMPVQIEEQCGD